MANYIHRIHLNRPKKTRLIIAVRFVVTAAVSSISSELDSHESTSPNGDSLDLMTVAGEQIYRSDSREAATAGVRGTVAMRLRLVGPEESTMKEYHHAESLPA
jgi:spore germination protein YaaH